MRWWTRHFRAGEAWLEQHFPKDDEDRLIAACALDVLVDVPMVRDPEGPLPTHSWLGITAHEVLFEVLARRGVPRCHPILLAERIRDLAAHFAALGLMPGHIHARLDAELEEWTPRYHAFCTRRTWYAADGTVTEPGMGPGSLAGEARERAQSTR
jgi:hypothetical protein